MRAWRGYCQGLLDLYLSPLSHGRKKGDSTLFDCKVFETWASLPSSSEAALYPLPDIAGTDVGWFWSCVPSPTNSSSFDAAQQLGGMAKRWLGIVVCPILCNFDLLSLIQMSWQRSFGHICPRSGNVGWINRALGTCFRTPRWDTKFKTRLSSVLHWLRLHKNTDQNDQYLEKNCFKL